MNTYIEIDPVTNKEVFRHVTNETMETGPNGLVLLGLIGDSWTDETDTQVPNTEILRSVVDYLEQPIEVGGKFFTFDAKRKQLLKHSIELPGDMYWLDIEGVVVVIDETDKQAFYEELDTKNNRRFSIAASQYQTLLRQGTTYLDTQNW